MPTYSALVGGSLVLDSQTFGFDNPASSYVEVRHANSRYEVKAGPGDWPSSVSGQLNVNLAEQYTLGGRPVRIGWTTHSVTNYHRDTAEEQIISVRFGLAAWYGEATSAIIHAYGDIQSATLLDRLSALDLTEGETGVTLGDQRTAVEDASSASIMKKSPA